MEQTKHTTLAKGARYDESSMEFSGAWTPGDGSGHEGYHWSDYFDEDMVYLGPDKHRIEPIFDVIERPTHTPGPWENHKWNSEEHQISAKGGTIALVSHSHSLVQEAEADANARLIAAAPDLLETCKWVLDWLSSFSMPPTSTIQEKQEAMAVLQRAIAKATRQEVPNGS